MVPTFLLSENWQRPPHQTYRSTANNNNVSSLFCCHTPHTFSWWRNNFHSVCTHIKVCAHFTKCCDCQSYDVHSSMLIMFLIVLANWKAWLAPALICCLNNIMLSDRLWANTAFTMLSFYLCLLENWTQSEQNSLKYVYSSFQDLLLDHYERMWRISETEGESMTIGKNCVRCVDFQVCGLACWLSFIL